MRQYIPDPDRQTVGLRQKERENGEVGQCNALLGARVSKGTVGKMQAACWAVTPAFIGNLRTLDKG